MAALPWVRGDALILRACSLYVNGQHHAAEVEQGFAASCTAKELSSGIRQAGSSGQVAQVARLLLKINSHAGVVEDGLCILDQFFALLRSDPQREEMLATATSNLFDQRG